MASVTAVRSDFRPQAIRRSRSESLVTIVRVHTPDLVVALEHVLVCCPCPCASARPCACALSACHVGIHDAGHQRVGIDDHELAGEIGIVGCEIEREKAAEAVAHDDRGGRACSCGCRRRWPRGPSRETEPGTRGTPANPASDEHVQLIVVLVMGDRAVPDFAGAGEAGNEDHGAAVAGDLDLEWLLGRQSGAECEGDQECFHSSDCVPGVVEDGVKCDERFLRGAGGSEMVLGDRGTVMGCSAAIAAA